MRTISKYQKMLKEYSVIEILNMYRDSKIELNEKEWDNLHKRIEKKLSLKNNKKKESKCKAILLCLTIIIIVSILSIGDFVDQTKKCNMIKGHTCTKYEIEKLGD